MRARQAPGGWAFVARVGVVLLLADGCGSEDGWSSTGEHEPGPRQAGGGGEPGSCPAGPYGVSAGDTIGNLSFATPSGEALELTSYFGGHVRFPNVATLPAGIPVELVAIGNAGTEGVIKAGTLGVIGKGRASGDGLTVESDPALDTGLITLGWIGYRPARP